MDIFTQSLLDYKRNFNEVFLFSLLAILAIALSVISPTKFYVAFSSLLLRLPNLPELSVADLFVAFFITLLSLFLLSVSFAGIISSVRERRTMYSLKRSIFKDIIIRASPKIFYYFLFLFLLYSSVVLLSYFFNMPFKPLNIFTFIISYVTFFYPYSLVLEGPKERHALRRALNHVKRHPFFPLIWALTGFALIFIPSVLLSLFIPYEVVKYLIFVLNTMFILPYVIILGGHMYLQRYPLLP